MPPCYFVYYNNQMKIAKEIFTETHMDLVKADSEWLGNTTDSSSVVAALIATIAFATSAAIPRGDVAGDVPGHPHFSVPRNGFRKSPTQEAFDKLKYVAIMIYSITCLSVSFFAIMQFSLYFDPLWAPYVKVPSTVTK
ncbi:hypothetical protein FEM48_Zijuj09G0044500 [Ziziphus jujuba var. spinosa]|uniref:PGG domain-containing protein n=1 Tax=Ziziphus jujuba var. spinosa TaxID=714518 RepID=A0A978UQW4_ZIZJJ|nr:hypothetical protein FEM48_Zijuj09G0044500 [Ziziphus jujuba var. spinosa]